LSEKLNVTSAKLMLRWYTAFSVLCIISLGLSKNIIIIIHLRKTL